MLRDEVWPKGADALILQEADEETRPHRGILDIAGVEAVTGLRYAHHDPSHRWSEASHGFLGTILFLAPRIEVDSIALIDLPGRCHRGAVVAECRRDGQRLRLIGTHLSLWQGLRLAQMRTICQYLYRVDDRPTILAGDLNEWRVWGGMALSAPFIGKTFTGPAKPTFPIIQPLLPLDRVLATSPATVTSTKVLDGSGIREASDHRPLYAEVALGG